jgi:hypothetical protein
MAHRLDSLDEWDCVLEACDKSYITWMEKNMDINKFQRVYKMRKTWVEINHLLESSMECKG